MINLELIDQQSQLIYKISVGIVISYAIFGWLTLTGIKLNYGRLSNSMMNIYINPKIAWFIFQIPNLLWALYFILYLGHPVSFAYSLFILHYINRDLIYPLSLKTQTKVPFEIAANAFIFTLGNGYLQGYANFSNAINGNPTNIALGTLVFGFGIMINIYSDNILQQAKQKALKDAKQEQNSTKTYDKTKVQNKKYVLINQFLFKYVSNPNYFGQIIQWIGYAIVCWNYQGFLFALSTANILIPAAIVRSKWNHKNIHGYPKQRKAVIPFLL